MKSVFFPAVDRPSNPRRPYDNRRIPLLEIESSPYCDGTHGGLFSTDRDKALHHDMRLAGDYEQASQELRIMFGQ